MAEIILQAKVENLSQVLNFVEEQLTEQGCPMKALMQIQMAVEEIFVNIAHYAYISSDGMATIEMETGSEPLEAVITFVDNGVPYNPLEKEDPDISLSAEDRSVGGLGIYMVKKSMDCVEYHFKDGKNRLTIHKKF